jgi:hypothetical protein
MTGLIEETKKVWRTQKAEDEEGRGECGVMEEKRRRGRRE